MTWTTTLLFVLAAFAAIALLVRLNFIVIDRHVLWWQVAPVLARGIVRNMREYRAVLSFVEQIFERGGFDQPDERKLADRLNAMLAEYHTQMQGQRGVAP